MIYSGVEWLDYTTCVFAGDKLILSKLWIGDVVLSLDLQKRAIY
jgi:hypothetical protein